MGYACICCVKTGTNKAEIQLGQNSGVQIGTGKNGQAVSDRNKMVKHGGASRDRTDDLIVANDALSQLSYSPKHTETSTGNNFTSAERSHKIGSTLGRKTKRPITRQ